MISNQLKKSRRVWIAAAPAAGAAAALMLLLFIFSAPTAHAGAVVKPQPTTRTVFKSSGTFTVPRNVSNVDVLVVAGGGGGTGGSSCCLGGGGGGAGGLIYKPSFRVTPSGSISVTVGNGGGNAASGENSVFSSLTAIGGGRGGNHSGLTSTSGGSSGGTPDTAQSGDSVKAAISGQGNVGGTNTDATNLKGGGGGGAGSVGGNTGLGGEGLQYSISGTNQFYAAGGGGAFRSNGGFQAGALGGSGIGGNGTDSNTSNATNGVANTGSGGGAGPSTGSAGGGAGGSGVVIVAYNNPDPYWRNVVLLAGNNNGTASSTTFIDQSLSKHKLTPAGNAQWDALYAPTGAGSSMLSDGSGDVISSPDSPDWDLSGGDYTIEFMLRQNSNTGAIWLGQSDASADGGWIIGNFDGVNTISYQQNGGGQNMQFSWTHSTATWYHIEIDRYGGTTNIFVDGVSIGTSANNPAQNNATSLRMFKAGQSGLTLDGSMSNVRITKGVARHRANFTKPTLGLPVTIASSIVKKPCIPDTVVGQDGLTYGVVLAEDGKCWLDRNLGAAQVASASANGTGYGDLYQWGRLYDGHQATTSAVTFTGSAGDVPGNSSFIATTTSPYDWRNSQNNNLWQGVSGTNNPCPTGFRLPTGGAGGEWATLVTAAGITNAATAFSSSLKLPQARYRDRANGNLGSDGLYWSSSISGSNASNLYFSTSGVNSVSYASARAFGFSVRCVRNQKAVVATANSSQNSKSTSGLVGLWSFDNPDMAGVTAYDRSGSGNNGTLTAGPTRTAGKIGQGLKFDGTNQYVDVPDNNSLDLTTDITVSSWIYLNNLTSNDGFDIVDKGPTGYIAAVYKNFNGGASRGKVSFGKNGTDEVLSNTILSVGRWYHIVATRTGGSSSIYINGVLDKTGTPASFSNTTQSLFIGRNSYSSAWYADGKIDDVRIYNRALSAAEVKLLYNQGR